MKIHRYLRSTLPALAGLLLTCSAGLAQTATTYTNSFDSASSTASWIYWYGLGYSNTGMTWDATKDATTNAGSGAVMVSLPFSTGGDQGVWFGTFGNNSGYDGSVIVNGLLYDSVSMDVLVDPSTPLNGAGNFGLVQMGIQSDISGNWNGLLFGNGQTIPASATNTWVHLVQPIDYTASGLNSAAGMVFKINSYGGYPQAPMKLWLDNVQVNASAGPPPPPPTMTGLTKPNKGLNLIGTSAAGQYGRQNIATVGASYQWVGNDATDPVTYALTISSYPAADTSGWQTHLFLIPHAPGNESAPDWNEPDIIFLHLEQNASGDGGATATFRYKTNWPGTNYMIFDSALTNVVFPWPRPSITCGSPLGTWSLSFFQDTNVTITTPCGTSTNFNIPADVAALFGDALTVYVGAQPNNAAQFGKSTVLSHFKISNGANTMLDDPFTAPTLDTFTWAVRAADAGGVTQVPPDAAYWLGWTIPDDGYSIQTTTNLLDANSWTTLTGPNSAAPLETTPTKLSSHRMQILPASALGDTNHSYFRLLQDH